MRSRRLGEETRDLRASVEEEPHEALSLRGRDELIDGAPGPLPVACVERDDRAPQLLLEHRRRLGLRRPGIEQRTSPFTVALRERELDRDREARRARWGGRELEQIAHVALPTGREQQPSLDGFSNTVEPGRQVAREIRPGSLDTVERAIRRARGKEQLLFEPADRQDDGFPTL